MKTVEISDELYKLIEVDARRNGISVKEWVLQAISDKFTQAGKKCADCGNSCRNIEHVSLTDVVISVEKSVN